MALKETTESIHEEWSFFGTNVAKTPAPIMPSAKATRPYNQHTQEVVDKSVVIQSLEAEKAKNLEDAMGSMGQPPRALSSILFYV